MSPVYQPQHVPVSRSHGNGLTQEQVRGILRRADRNGDGCLSKDELTVAVKELGSRFPYYRVRRCLAYADADHDGCISAIELDGLIAYILKWQADKLKD